MSSAFVVFEIPACGSTTSGCLLTRPGDICPRTAVSDLLELQACCRGSAARSKRVLLGRRTRTGLDSSFISDCSVCFYPQPPITLDAVYAAIHVSAGVPCPWSQSQVLCRSKNRSNCVPDNGNVESRVTGVVLGFFFCKWVRVQSPGETTEPLRCKERYRKTGIARQSTSPASESPHPGSAALEPPLVPMSCTSWTLVSRAPPSEIR